MMSPFDVADLAVARTNPVAAMDVYLPEGNGLVGSDLAAAPVESCSPFAWVYGSQPIGIGVDALEVNTLGCASVRNDP
jgi:hypothetical protein